MPRLYIVCFGGGFAAAEALATGAGVLDGDDIYATLSTDLPLLLPDGDVTVRPLCFTPRDAMVWFDGEYVMRIAVVTDATTPGDVANECRIVRPDAVLIDYRMGDQHVREILGYLRALREEPA